MTSPASVDKSATLLVCPSCHWYAFLPSMRLPHHRYTYPIINTPAPLSIHLPCCWYACLLSICMPCCQYTCLLLIHLPPVDTLTLWSIHPPPVDVPAPLSIHLCSLLLLWAMAHDVVDGMAGSNVVAGNNDVAGGMNAHIPQGGEGQGTTVTWGWGELVLG